jgi:hypothetical protein
MLSFMLKRSLVCGFALLAFASCKDGNRQVETSDSTTVTRTETPTGSNSDNKPVEIGTPDQDTASHVATSDLPPIVSPLSPYLFHAYFPTLEGYSASDIDNETRIRPNLKISRASRTYKNGDKTITITINDFAYVPSQYAPYAQYRGEYLQDDNIERTESTRISGYEAIQTWLKKENRAEITLFPGKRYVVQVTADGVTDVSEARRILDGMNLTGLEGLN